MKCLVIKQGEMTESKLLKIRDDMKKNLPVNVCYSYENGKYFGNVRIFVGEASIANKLLKELSHHSYTYYAIPVKIKGSVGAYIDLFYLQIIVSHADIDNLKSGINIIVDEVRIVNDRIKKAESKLYKNSIEVEIETIEKNQMLKSLSKMNIGPSGASRIKR